jgi:hypothetical protein
LEQKQNGGQNQDGHEFSLAQYIFMQINWKLGFGKKSLKKSVEDIFSKFQNGGLSQYGVSHFSTDFKMWTYRSSQKIGLHFKIGREMTDAILT